MFEVEERERKARTIVSVLSDYFDGRIDKLSVLVVGCSTGIIDNLLADHFGKVIGIDIDEPAIVHATNSHRKENLEFLVADAMHLHFGSRQAKAQHAGNLGVG